MNYEDFIISLAYFAPDIVGLAGVFFVLLAYLLLQINYWTSKDFAFSLCNLFGSVCIICSLYFNWNLSAFIIEIVWLFISVFGLCYSKGFRKAWEKWSID